MTPLDLPAADGGWRDAPARARRGEWADHPAALRQPGGLRRRPRGRRPASADNAPGAPAVVDWDATLAFRRELWSATASAWPRRWTPRSATWAWTGRPTQELIRRSAAEAARAGGRIASGAGTDHRPARPRRVDEVRRRLRRAGRVRRVDRRAGDPDGLARSSPRVASGADDYLKVYGRLLGAGPRAGDPALAGRDVRPGAARLLGHRPTSTRPPTTFLDAGPRPRRRRSTASRSRCSTPSTRSRCGPRLPGGVRLYTGDDFNYPELIRGDGDPPLRRAARHLRRHRPGRLRRAAGARRAATSRRTTRRWRRRCRCRATCSRRRPTTTRPGIAFLAWLAGHQPGFTMVGGLQSARSAVHLGRLFGLADDAGLLPDPELAAHRMRALARRSAGLDAMTDGRRPVGRPARCHPARRPAAGRLSLNQRPRRLDAARGDRRVRARRAAGDRPVARAGRRGRPGDRRAAGCATPGCGSPRSAAAASSPRRPGGSGRRSTTTARAIDEAADARRARAWCWCPAACPTATATSRRPRRASPTRSPSWSRTPRDARRPARASSRCTRCSPPTAASCPPSARPSTSPSSSRSSAVGVVVDTFHVWWEPGVLDQIARAGAAHRALPGRATGSRRCPPDALLSRGMMGDGHIDFAALHRRGRRGRLHRRRRGRDLQRRHLGATRRRGRRRPWPGATSSWWSRS